MASFKRTTLLHLLRDNNGVIETLMPFQTRIIVGRKAYGGKVEENQTILQNMVDETFIESGEGIIVKEEDIKIYGKINFYNDLENESPRDTPSTTMTCAITWKFSGEAKESPEMIDPQWYPIHQLPIKDMIVGDEFFLSLLLVEKYFIGDIRRVIKKGENGNLQFLCLISENVRECNPSELDLGT